MPGTTITQVPIVPTTQTTGAGTSINHEVKLLLLPPPWWTTAIPACLATLTTVCVYEFISLGLHRVVWLHLQESAFDAFFGDGAADRTDEGAVILQSDQIQNILRDYYNDIEGKLNEGPSKRLYKARRWVNESDWRGAREIVFAFRSLHLNALQTDFGRIVVSPQKHMTIRYELEPLHRNTPDVDLADDLKRVAHELGSSTVTIRQYDGSGRFSASALQRRFRSWHSALERAGLIKVRNINVSEQDLFANLAEVWTRLGRQPRMAELTARSSKVSADTYKRRFRSWRGALEAFVRWANEGNATGTVAEGHEKNTGIRGQKVFYFTF